MLLSSQSFLLSLVLISSLQSLLQVSSLQLRAGPREPSSLFLNMLVTYINMQLKIAPFLVSQVTHHESKIFPLVCEVRTSLARIFLVY